MSIVLRMTVDVVSTRNLLVLLCQYTVTAVHWISSQSDDFTLAAISCICQLVVAAHCVLMSLLLHSLVTGQWCTSRQFSQYRS